MYSVCRGVLPAEFRHALVRQRRAQGFGRLLAVFALLTIAAPVRQASAAILQQMQSGTVSSNGNGITSVTISSIDTTKSVLIFQTRTDSGVPGGSTVRGRIQSSTVLQFERVTTESAPIVIQWYVATFGSGVSVQRGEVSQAATTVNVPITSVGTLNQAFVLFSKTTASGEAEWSNDDAVAGDLTTTTNLQFRSSLLNAAHIISWQVVRFTNAADINVQRGTIATMTGAATSVTATLSPAVNLGKTFVLASWRTTGTGVDIGSRMLRARLTSSTQITIDRSVSGSPDDINEIWWQVIELKDASTVWSGAASFATGVAQATSPLGLPDTNIDRAVGFISGQGGAGQSMGRSPYVTSDVIGVANATVSFTNNTVTLDRINTAAAADVDWFVVQFDGGPPFKVGSFTKSAATGTQTIAHGLGQVPKAMLFWAEGTRDDITFRGAASASTTGPSTVTVIVPAGTVADDVMIATVGVRSSAAIVAPPAGWTQVRRTNNAADSTNSLITYYRVATASEPANYTWTFDATTGAVGTIVSFAGVDTTNPINVENGQTTASAMTHTAPAVTTTVAKTMIVTAHTFSSSATWTPAPAGLVEAIEEASETPSANAGQSITVNYGIRPTAGLTPTYLATALGPKGNTADSGNVETLALRPASHIYYSLGMTDGTTSRSVSSSSVDAAGTTNASSRTAAKAITMVESQGAGGIVVAEADLQSWTDTNVVFNWTTNDAAPTVVHYIAFGGTDLSAKVVGWTTGTGTGNRVVTGVGFQPNLVIHAHAGAQQVAAVPSTMANGAFGFGVMSAEGDQWANGFLTLDNAGLSDAQRGQRTDSFLYALDENLAVQKQASFVSMDANGFTANITTAASANDMQVFSLALSGLNATVGSFNKSVAAQPASQAITGVNFKPGAVLFTSVQDVTQAAPVAHARFGLGASDGATDGASTFEDLDASATSDVGGTDKATKAFIKVNNSTSTVNAEADLTTMDADGFTLNWTTNDAVATEILYLAMGPMAVTEVRMISTAATTYPSGVLVEWKTGYESDNLGFNVYREVDGIRTKVNGSPITGSGLQAGPGHAVNGQQSYARWDLGAAALTASAYWLEDLDFNGTGTLHGPITPIVSQFEEPSTLDSGELDDLDDPAFSIRRIFFSDANDPAHLGPRVTEPQLPQEVATQWALAAANGTVKIGIRKPGWYRVAQADLVAAGLSSQVERQRLQLFVDGTEQAIHVSGGTTGTFGPTDAIEFYAFGADTAYTDTRIYWLQAGDHDGQRIGVDTGGAFDASTQTGFSSMLRRKDRGVYLDSLNNGDAENWFGPVVDPSAPTALTLTPNNLDRSFSQARLTVKLQGVTISSTSPHNVGVTVNGTDVGDMSFDGRTLAEQMFVVPMQLLADGENIVGLEARGGDGDASLVDSITLDYPHTYQANADRLRFVVDGPASIAVGGFASPSIRVFDITHREAPVQLQTTIATASGLSTVTAQVSGSGPRTLMAFSDETVLAPEFVRANHSSTLHATTNAFNYVAISPADFITQLAPLADLRQHQGLHPIVVDVEDIYDEFSFGQKTPQAIRDFLQWAQAKWATAPRFVVLAGDASVDPRDYSGRGSVDFVPTKTVPLTQKTGETPSDDWFVDYNDDGLADAAIGRLSIRTASQATAVVAKIVDYDPNQQQPWTKDVLLIADRYDGTTNFEQATEALAALAPNGYTARQVAVGSLGNAAAHEALVNSVNGGQLIVNYAGHGSVGLWNNGLLTNADVTSWTNLERLPFVIAMNCLNGLFNQSYDEESLAEALQRAANGGAVAVWASSTDTAPAAQALVNQELLRLIFAGTYSTLGEAVAAAKGVVASHDLRSSWIFFGDPAMRLAGQFPVAAGPAPPPAPEPHPYVEDPPPPPPPPPPPAPAPDPSPAGGPAAPAPAEMQPPVATVPGAPSSLTSSVFGSTLVLTWAAPSSGGAPGWYVIEAGSFAGSRDYVQSTGNLSTSFTADGVAAGTYFVRVRAASVAGTSAASNEVIVVVGAGSGSSPQSRMPAPPGGLAASVSASSVTLSWNTSTLGGAPQTYWIDAGSSTGLSDLASFSTGSAATVLTLQGVPAGTYYVRVRAANGSGTSGSSNEVVVFVGGSAVCAVPPDTPSGLRSTVEGSTVVLGWNAPAGSPTSYIIEAASRPGAADLLVSDTGSTATAMIARNVTSGTYFVRVFARNACGVSGPSSEVVVVVP